jgi:hypothetical protein
MALGDYCLCEVCGGKSFYDARLEFDDVVVIDKDGNKEFLCLPVRCGDYAGLCVECAKTHKLVAEKRPTPVSVIVKE